MTISRNAPVTFGPDEVDPEVRLVNTTPGDVLLEDFLKPLGMSARALARDLDIPANRVTGIINGERAISAKTAILLSARFKTSAEFWMNLQVAHDLEEARHAMQLVA